MVWVVLAFSYLISENPPLVWIKEGAASRSYCRMRNKKELFETVYSSERKRKERLAFPSPAMHFCFYLLFMFLQCHLIFVLTLWEVVTEQPLIWGDVHVSGAALQAELLWVLKLTSPPTPHHSTLLNVFTIIVKLFSLLQFAGRWESGCPFACCYDSV